jgi:hypothetical protein
MTVARSSRFGVAANTATKKHSQLITESKIFGFINI